MSELSHIDQRGEARMVDVSAKTDSSRLASAAARVAMSEETFTLMTAGNLPKGDVFATARIAGIQAAKQCSQLIPLCHPLPLSLVDIDFEPDADRHCLDIVATCKTSGKTGVEMEALTAVSIAALTIYDMCKAVEKGMVIESIRLLEKQGGKSGHWHAAQSNPKEDSP